ncbi:hypothetical protein BGZ46_007261 [Entomortierella lignicola]|nr:hypothetical protein BGZ46_007261 [Entomortierella lignicola]
MVATSDHDERPSASISSVKENPAGKKPNQNFRRDPVRVAAASPELTNALRACIRAYGVGYTFVTAPKLIKTLLAFLLNPRKSLIKGRNPIIAFLISIAAIIKDGASSRRDGMSMLLLISLGGYKLLELFLNRGMKKVILAQQLQRQLEQKQQHLSIEGQQELTRNDAEKIELAPALRQRITMMASFVSSAAAIIFMHRYRPNHATIDYSLFAVVRAMDVFGHAAVKNEWGPKWLGSHGSLAVFVMACTEIMFSWLYEPHRLPGPYAFWITKMARMDKRLLAALQSVRLGSIKYGQPNTPELRGMLISLCQDLKLDPKMVHLLPALIKPKVFLKKLKEDPVGTISSTLWSAARSSAFLATYIALIWYGICFWRSKIMPFAEFIRGRRISGNVIDNIYGSLLGSFLCGFSVQIEKPHRRGEMALYVLPRAMYSMWSRVMAGRLSRKVEIAGETLMFATSMSVLLTAMMWDRNMVRPSMRGILGWLLEVSSLKQRGHSHNKGKAKSQDVELPHGDNTLTIGDKDALAAVERERSA